MAALVSHSILTHPAPSSVDNLVGIIYMPDDSKILGGVVRSMREVNEETCSGLKLF